MSDFFSDEDYAELAIEESKMYENMAILEAEIEASNKKVLLDIVAMKGQKYANSMMGFIKEAQDYQSYDPWVLVSKPYGNKQKEDYGMVEYVWVDQWSVGDGGDSFNGYLYFELKEDLFLKVFYSC